MDKKIQKRSRLRQTISGKKQYNDYTMTEDDRGGGGGEGEGEGGGGQQGKKIHTYAMKQGVRYCRLG